MSKMSKNTKNTKMLKMSIISIMIINLSRLWTGVLSQAGDIGGDQFVVTRVRDSRSN